MTILANPLAIPLISQPVSDERILAVLRTMPRSTTAQVSGAIIEDIGYVKIDVPARLKSLREKGLVGRHNRALGGGTHYTWWVLDGTLEGK